ncbi:MAG: segregation/condensation protein A [Candidatus Zixiibacteriota bacterium]
MITNKPKDNYSVELEVFQGPLDLLLYLIQKDEVDIYDIPIARVTEQYMQYIEVMKILNLELAGEYILMAATLIRIKTKLLLPRDEIDGEEADPREELIAALLEYKKFKEASEILREKRILEERIFVPPPVECQNIKGEKVVLSNSTTLYDMLTVLKEVLDRAKQEQMYEIDPEMMGIEDRVDHVLAKLRDKDSISFIDLFSDIPRKFVAILTFLAILELIKLHRITVHQSLPFSELRVYRGEMFNNAQPAIEFIKDMSSY